uniref:Uncharacterized protein n=1 Tax=Leersia perrieri TaxID=77586 RepID=A0A0D9XY83_9ORYZ
MASEERFKVGKRSSVRSSEAAVMAEEEPAEADLAVKMMMMEAKRRDNWERAEREKNIRQGIDLATTLDLERIKKKFVITDPRILSNPIGVFVTEQRPDTPKFFVHGSMDYTEQSRMVAEADTSCRLCSGVYSRLVEYRQYIMRGCCGGRLPSGGGGAGCSGGAAGGCGNNLPGGGSGAGCSGRGGGGVGCGGHGGNGAVGCGGSHLPEGCETGCRSRLPVGDGGAGCDDRLPSGGGGGGDCGGGSWGACRGGQFSGDGGRRTGCLEGEQVGGEQLLQAAPGIEELLRGGPNPVLFRIPNLKILGPPLELIQAMAGHSASEIKVHQK